MGQYTYPSAMYAYFSPAIVDIVGYHLNSVSRWIREFERDNRLEGQARGHRASIFSAAEYKEIIELIAKQPDITLLELHSHFAKDCSLNAIHKLLKKLGFVVKKKLRASGKKRGSIVRAEQRFK